MCDLVSAYKSGGESAVLSRVSQTSSPAKQQQQQQQQRQRAAVAVASQPPPIGAAAREAVFLGMRGMGQQLSAMRQPVIMPGAAGPSPFASESMMYASARDGDRVASREMMAGMSAGSIASMLYREVDREEARTGFVTPDRSSRATQHMTADSGMYEPIN